jgi:hypothetical protein
MRPHLFTILLAAAVAAVAAAIALVVVASPKGDARIGRLSPLAGLPRTATALPPASPAPTGDHGGEHHHGDETSDD